MKNFLKRTCRMIHVLFCSHSWDETPIDTMSLKKTCIKCKTTHTEFYI